MDLKKKIIALVGFCIILSAGSVIILNRIFAKIEDQHFHKVRMASLIGSKIMSEMMEFMVDTGELTEAQVFDTSYVAIPGTDPIKYHTQYDGVFDKNIQAMEDEFLLDDDIIFAILIDKNGYVPTHNTRFSIPPDKDRARNLLLSRSKRNFATNPEIQEQLQYRGYGTLRVFYTRDTGESMWIIGTPVRVFGRHWGSFIIGVSLQRIQIIKNQMIILIVTIMFVILSLTMLAILAVIPQRYLLVDDDAPRY